MNISILIPLILTPLFILTGCGSDEETNVNETPLIKTPDQNITIVPEGIEELNITSIISLGKALFKDKDLSLTRSLSCASCHNLEHGTVDDRNESFIGASLGDDDYSLGDRNAPMVTYASYTPKFSFLSNIVARGGQFWDGRSKDLIEQAKGPFLNNIEMQMPDIESVITRIVEKEPYVTSLKKFYGEDVFITDESAFEAIATAIAAYESSPELSTFDSKFDKYLERKIYLNAQELKGASLFNSSGCATCHDIRSVGTVPPMFTFYAYHNIGVPKNSKLRLVNDTSPTYIDKGLSNRSDFNDSFQGMFKTPSLRNVAVSAPYTHNGKFKTLKAMIHFYNTRDVKGAINPDTNMRWEPSEVMQNRFNGVGDLELTDLEEDAIIAFLKTLTDKRYEGLLK